MRWGFVVAITALACSGCTTNDEVTEQELPKSWTYYSASGQVNFDANIATKLPGQISSKEFLVQITEAPAGRPSSTTFLGADGLVVASQLDCIMHVQGEPCKIHVYRLENGDELSRFGIGLPVVADQRLEARGIEQTSSTPPTFKVASRPQYTSELQLSYEAPPEPGTYFFDEDNLAAFQIVTGTTIWERTNKSAERIEWPQLDAEANKSQADTFQGARPDFDSPWMRGSPTPASAVTLLKKETGNSGCVTGFWDYGVFTSVSSVVWPTTRHTAWLTANETIRTEFLIEHRPEPIGPTIIIQASETTEFAPCPPETPGSESGDPIATAKIVDDWGTLESVGARHSIQDEISDWHIKATGTAENGGSVFVERRTSDGAITRTHYPENEELPH